MNPSVKVGFRAVELATSAMLAGQRMAKIGCTNALINILRENGKIPAKAPETAVKELETKFRDLDILLPEGYEGAGVQPYEVKLHAMSSWLRREHRQLRADARADRRHAKALRRLAREYVYRPATV